MNELFNLSAPQNSILLTEQYYANTSINNIGGGITIHKALDFDLFKKAINNFVKYNDSFRIRLKQTNNGIKQYFEEYSEFDVDIIDLNDESEIDELDKKVMYRPMELYNSQLFQFIIFRLKNNYGGYVIKMHHIISDAWTSGLMCREIMHEYSNLLNGINETHNTSLTYKNYLKSEENYFSSTKFEKDQLYWKEKFSTIPNAVSIPSTSTTTNTFSCEGERSSFVISKKDMEQITQYCSTHSVSVFNFFMSVLATYINQINDATDFVIGTPILNRSNVAEKNTSGMFINIAPLRVSFENIKSFSELVTAISKDSMGLLRHQKYPYQKILEDLRKNDSSIPNLYNLVLSYQITRSNNECDIPYDTRWAFNGCTADDIDIHLYDMDEKGILNVAYDYKVSKYSYVDILNLHNRLMHIIKQILKNEKIEIKDIEIVTEEEKHKILYEFNNTFVDYPKDKTIVDLFEEQVEKTPDNIAVTCNGESLTYRELNEKANQLAWYLKNEKGIKESDIIGIMMYRSLELSVGLLAILKSGATYLPIDPSYPETRISYMLSDSNSKLLLLDLKTKELIQSSTEYVIVNLNNNDYENNPTTNIDLNINSYGLAYLIYTSGSTGKPKGVMLKHHNLTNFIYAMQQKIDFSPNKVMVSVTTICFDIFGLEFWTSLASGMKVILANELEQNSAELLNNLCKKNNVHMIQTTPSRFNVFLQSINDCEFLTNMTEILIGGEALSEILVKNLKNITNAKIINMYGPTETTIWSTCKEISKTDIITIGKPIMNTTCYILNKNQQLLPPFVPGELYIGGDGVSNGYLNREDLTNEKFITSKFKKDEIIYNTNDLAYYNNNGEIIHLGRTDFQVKIRGYRIELGEIENKINQIENITNSIVIADSTKKHLICYYTATAQISTISLINHLLQDLPNYMIPSYFYKLDAFPLTPNGKIDRKKLPLPSNSTSNKKIIEPQTDNQKLLKELFESTLKIDKISIDDNFFELGGDSLSAINLSIQIYNKTKIQLTIKEIFEHSVLLDLANYISNYNKAQNTITLAKPQDFYPASPAQKRMYYASKADSEESILYNIPGALVFDAIPAIERLNACFDELFERHESLRTHFEIRNDDIVQIIDPNIGFKLDIQHSTSTNTEYLLKKFVKPFNLSKSPLFRATLVIQNESSATLLIDMHHSISDGTSVGIILKEIEDLYNGKTLKENKITYKDYSEWERNNFESSSFKESEKFWVEQFSDELPVLNMPTTYERPLTQSFEGSNFNFIIDQKLKNKIFKTCTELSITPYMFLLSAYYVLLYKYTNQTDIIIGTPVSGRNITEISNIVGMFVNSLPLRANIKSTISFKTFLNNIKKVCLNAFEHQEYPFDFLINKLDIQRNSNRSAMFDTMFVYENFGLPKLNLKNINSEYIPVKNTISKYDFSLQVTPTKNYLDIQLEYCTKLFDEEFMKKFANSYVKILKTAVNDVSNKISDIEIISEEEKNKILYDFNNTKMDYDKEKNIQTIFEEHAKNNPNNIAIVFEENKITYNELNKKANQLAHYLIQNGIKQNDIVGIMLNRSIETIICMLGILKAGAAYMLIDKELPKDRIEFMLNNCKSKLLITSSKLKKIDFENIYKYNFEDLQYYNIQNPNVENDNEDLFTIIYTSGSTGTPKGVTLKRKGVINMALNYNSHMHTSTCKTFISISSVAFDMFIVENFVPLLTGKTVILTNEEQQKIPQEMSNLIIKNDIDFILTTPSRIELLLNDENSIMALAKLKIIQLGGEVFTSTLYNKLKDYTQANIYNGYGPSEITACCSNQKVLKTKPINIGKPNYNTKIYILDTDLNLCPIGVSGEICISGDGVSKGYINNTELTKKAFIKNPFGEGFLYKSGDIGKYTENGEIEYIGRKDFQIKIRGLRVELSEIENKILEIPEIENCAVIYKKDEIDNYLVAYFTAKSDISISEVRQTLSKILPLYMVPKYIIKLDKLPITTNGKVNKRELENKKINHSANKTYVAPENEIQELFCNIWNKFLNTKIGIDDNIFECGVDSLIAIKFKTELLSHNINLPYANLFKYPTVRELSEKTELQESTSTIENFDYTKINKILAKNNMETLQNSKITHNYNNNLLLLGSNGFVGSHILYNFIKQDSGKVYCIIRERNNKSARNRLIDTLHFYFDTELDSFIDNRIIILQGDITKEKFGLEDDIFDKLTKNISTIINSAAVVKHYGDIKKFNNVNIKLTEKLCNYAIENNKKLLHISTTSISESSNIDATYVASKKYENTEFCENNLYVGQVLDNAYTATKFEAERIILTNMANNNLNAKIIRIGNITNRYSDGGFQINVEENAFANRLKSFIELKTIPEYLQALPLEFTPVDLCGKAIVYILQNNIKDFSVYHLYNNNSIYLKNLIDILNNNSINVEFVDQKKFKTNIKKLLDSSENQLSGFINDLNDNYELIYERDVNLSCELTTFFLKLLGFEWPEIDENYITKYTNYMKKINFFKEDK